MKMATRLTMVLAVLAICLPADGEILIYSKTMTSFEVVGEEIPGNGPEWDWAMDSGRRTGYLVLDVDYEDGEIVEIYDAVQVEYWREGPDKYYRQIDHTFDVNRVEIDGVVHWVLEDLTEEPGGLRFMIVEGRTRTTNIGLGWAMQRPVPTVLQGAFLRSASIEGYIYRRACCVSLRLNFWWTRLANHSAIGGQNFEFAEQDIVKAWLGRLRYEEVEDGPPAEPG
jgi:hypothetical protein